MGESMVTFTPGVSIHAPVKGATNLAAHLVIMDSVSIHAPVKGATYAIWKKQVEQNGFNSRTRKGCDNIELNDYIKKI